MRSHLKQVKNEEKNMYSSQNTYFKNRYKHAKQC